MVRGTVPLFLLVLNGGTTGPPSAQKAATQDKPAAEPSKAEEQALGAPQREAVELISWALEQGDLEEARGLLHDAVAELDEPEPGQEAAFIGLLRRLEALAEELESLEELERIRTRLLAALLRVSPPESEDILATKMNLAVVRGRCGDSSGALALAEEALADLERLLPADHPNVLFGMGDLAVLKYRLGDSAGARRIFEEMLATWTRIPPPSEHDLLMLKSNLAALRNDFGDLLGARELQEEVLAVWTRTLPADEPQILSLKLNLANTLAELGDLAAARTLGEEIVALCAKRLPPEHDTALRARENLAITRLDLGDLAGAQVLQEEVLAACSRRFPPDHPIVLGVQENLAVNRRFLGDLAGARELEERVLEARVALLPPSHVDRLIVQQNLADTLIRLGEAEGARARIRSLLAGIGARAVELRSESPRVAREGARLELLRLTMVLALCERADPEGTLEAELFATLEALRVASVASSEVALALARLPELAAKAREAVRLRAQLNDHVAGAPTQGPGLDAEGLEGWRSGLLALTLQRDRLEGELRAALASAGAFVGSIGKEEVAAALRPGCAAVSFLRCPRGESLARTRSELPPESDRLLAFVVRPDGTVRRIELGPAAELEELVQDWRAALGRPLMGRGIGIVEVSSAEERSDDAGRRLRERVLDPVLAATGPVQVLHLELDDVLFLVPLDALPLEGGLLGERIAIRSEATLARLLRADPGVPEGEPVLAGGIDYDAEPGEAALVLDAATLPLENTMERSASGAAFAFLPGTRDESASIAELYAEVSEKEAILLTGKAATKAALLDAAPKTRFLHLATHGWFAGEGFRSQLDTSAERSMHNSWLRAEGTLTGFAPETLCGLALAGANRGKDALGRVSGILTAEELASFDLRNCELAVLSACETNVGIRRAGQGIQSLQSALHAAGARTAITSLWKVDDTATRQLFELFYAKLWKEKLGKSTALWQAKMVLRAEGHPPRDWAGWVLSGDPD